VAVCVLDASFTLQWIFKDEASAEGYATLAAVSAGGAVIPALWFVEITNVLGMAERRSRLDTAGMQRASALIQLLPLVMDEPASLAWSRPVLTLMRTYLLTAYDATYLELAMRLRLPLATKDRELLVAAPASGVPLFAALP
jgi:predicted nucleic acid-binding protein